MRWLLVLVLVALPAAAPDDVAPFAHPAAAGLDAAALRDAYALEGTGAGVRVAVVTWGPASQASLDAYADANGLPRSALAHHGDCSGPALDEWNLDVQMVKAAAPLAELRLHCAPSATFAALLDAVRDAVDQGADVMSLSWGACEARVPEATAAAYHEAFREAAARGVAVFAASGDGGSRECTRWSVGDDRLSAGWPATDPLVVAVGGTRLERGEAGWDERAWNACAPCPDREWSASGGGASLLHAAPWWLPEGPRPSPDVAAVADRGTGVEVHSNGRWLAMGGTSAAAPLWAGAWAAAVSELGRLGAPGPLLAQEAGVLRDVTLGSNGDYAAGPGRDLVTGWGAAQGAPLLDALRALPPAPADVSAARGPGRGEVTLSWRGEGTFLVLRGPRGEEAPLATVTGGGFVDAGLGDGARASYRVVAVQDGRLGVASAPVEGRTFAAPGAPSDVAWALDGLHVVLSWSPPEDDGGLPLAFRVWRDGALAGETAAPRFVDPACLGVCRYAVSAVNDVGEGPRSGDALAPGTRLG